MYFRLSVSLLLLYLLQIEADEPTWPRSAGPCTTPDGEQGECVLIHDCPVLANAFANPVINGTKELLEKFRCEWAYFRVCCISGWNSSNYGNKLSDRRYCGYQHTDDYFPTGNDTSLDEFPWLAALVGTHARTGEDKIVCHGSLINNRYILTSGYCVRFDEFDYQTSKVLLGKYKAYNTTSCVDLEVYGIECTETQEFGIEEKIVHPFYGSIHYIFKLWDIGLIRLNKTTSYTDYIRPICLPTQGTKFAEVGETLYTTGWGGITSLVNAPVKKKIKTILLTSEECQKNITLIPISSTYHICTLNVETETHVSCYSDSGAPVMYSYRNQWQIEGIVPSFSICGVYAATVHIRVSHYIDWIKRNIRP